MSKAPKEPALVKPPLHVKLYMQRKKYIPRDTVYIFGFSVLSCKFSVQLDNCILTLKMQQIFRSHEMNIYIFLHISHNFRKIVL